MAKEKRYDVVYSTDPDKMKIIREGECESDAIELSPEETTVYVSLDRKNRKGKTVTVLSGFQASQNTLKTLGKKLKAACGSGGTVRDNIIEIQGDHFSKICDILVDMKYKVKRR